MTQPSPQQALEQLAAQAPFQKRHLRLFLISIGGTFMDGYATLMTGVALPLFTLQEHPDSVLVGLLGAALVLWLQLMAAPYRSITALTAGSWFLMDIATYGVGLFTPIILAALLGSSAEASAAASSVITGEFHTIAGTGLVDTFLLVVFLLVPRFGPIRMQSIGFLGMAAGMAILTFGSLLPETTAHRIGLVFLGFIVFNLLMNARPNSTTFLLPAHLYPASVRATGAGFAAASGKVGATLGIFLLPILREQVGISGILVLMVAVSLLAWLVTVLFSRHLPRGTGTVAATLTHP